MASVINVEEKPAQEGKKAEKNSQSKNQITINFPPTINANVSGQLEIKAETRQADKHEEWYNAPDFWVAAFTGVLVFVTGWLTTQEVFGLPLLDSRKTPRRPALDKPQKCRIPSLNPFDPPLPWRKLLMPRKAMLFLCPDCSVGNKICSTSKCGLILPSITPGSFLKTEIPIGNMKFDIGLRTLAIPPRPQ